MAMVPRNIKTDLDIAIIHRVFLALLLVFSAVACHAVEPQQVINIFELDYPPELAVIERQQWGWVPPTISINEHQVRRITIHHGGLDFPDDKDPLQYLLALQSWGRSDKGWMDIPYHFMIDRHGQIYETRPINYPGDTNTTYDPAGHALIAVMGNYENQRLSELQMDALIGITVFLFKEFDVPIENIKGHKDYADTTCPGEDIYRYLRDGSIHAGVKASVVDETPSD